ncbi:LysR substrate-binding domain-containing protein [Paenibacillus caui]|uniref:LysR substrate-binding domain-containing protein n=1 Tax=Paenibacillus caui TaxID=2873927 RepID=UPI001CA985A3|nr:LysR substrate-binding domain-containing protein [Paenibacillus caui]
MYQLLERGDIDVAFANLEQPMPNMLVKKFLSEPMIVISKGKLPALGNALIDQELDTSNQLFFEWNPSFRAWYDRWIGERENPSIRLDAASLMDTFMDSPEKWAIVPMSLAHRFKKSGEFYLYHLESPPPERVCYQIQPRNPRSSAVESLRILDSCINAVMHSSNS